MSAADIEAKTSEVVELARKLVEHVLAAPEWIFQSGSAGSLDDAQSVARMIRRSLLEISQARYPEPTSLRDCCRWLGERPIEDPRRWWGRLGDDLVATDGRGVLVVRGDGGDAPRFEPDGWSDVTEKVVARALDDSRSQWESYVDAAELIASHPANEEGRRFFALTRTDERERVVANDVFLDAELVAVFVARAARFTDSPVRVRWSSDPIAPVFFSAEEADGCYGIGVSRLVATAVEQHPRRSPRPGCSARVWAAVVMPIRCGDADAGIHALRWCSAVRALR